MTSNRVGFGRDSTAGGDLCVAWPTAPTGDYWPRDTGTISSTCVTPTAASSSARSTALKARSIGLSFSPDSRLLAHTNGERNVFLWSVADGRLIRQLAGHTRGVYGAEFSPDGTRLASVGREVKLWDPVSFQELLTLPAPRQPDGRWRGARTVIASPSPEVL